MVRKLLGALPRWLFALAAVWAVIASVLVFTTAGGSMVAESNGGAPQVQQLSWYEMQGLWGVAILFIFAALFYAPWHFLRRDQRGWAAVFAVAGVLLTFLTGFSIGGYYFPGAVALLAGLIALPITRRA